MTGCFREGCDLLGPHGWLHPYDEYPNEQERGTSMKIDITADRDEQTLALRFTINRPDESALRTVETAIQRDELEELCEKLGDALEFLDTSPASVRGWTVEQ